MRKQTAGRNRLLLRPNDPAATSGSSYEDDGNNWRLDDTWSLPVVGELYTTKACRSGR